MAEFHEIVHARVREGAEGEPEAGEIHGYFAEDLAHHRGEVAVG